jgi:1A family penicillin-binding protein
MVKWFRNWQWSWERLKKKRLIKKNRSSRPKLTSKKIFRFLLISLAVLLMVAIGIVVWYARDLPQPGEVVRREGFTTRIMDRNGEVLYDIYQDKDRQEVTFEELPENLIRATIAIEDKDFYHHKGFSLSGIARGFYYTVFRGDVQGGSTLTQQLVKNVLLTSQRNIERKIKELLLAIQIETRFSKDQILTMYLNEAPYGGTAWGVGTAAELYFNKSVSELSLVESAILAGLPQQPTVYSPFGSDPEAYIPRTKNVLRRLREDGYITVEEEEEAVAQLGEVQFAATESSFLAPHFVMYVKQQLVDRYGEAMVESGGLKVTTTLDLSLQEEAEAVVESQSETMSAYDIGNAGVMVLNSQTGEILAMVGSKDYNEPNFGKFNTTTALRQPGSSIKPITYVTALQRGYTAAHLLFDTKTAFPGATTNKPYEPTNYDNTYSGPMQMRYVLANSKNVPAVKMLAQVGLKNMLQTAYEMGISTLEPTSENLSRLGLSVTLGGGEVRLIELAAAYSAFANGGFKVEPVAILKITDREGNILEENDPQFGRRVLEEGEAFVISDILADNEARSLAFGTNSLLNIPVRKVAVKTGTTNDSRDNWTIGWTPQVLVGVWVGNNDNSRMSYVASGFAGASPIWRKVILSAMEMYPGKDFVVPDSVVQVEVDQISGALAHDNFPSRREYFIKGTEPEGEDKVHVMLKVGRDNKNCLATPQDINAENYDQKEYILAQEEDPYESETNRWQVGIDNWLAEQGDNRYYPPTEYCDSNKVSINIEQPSNQSQVGNEFSLKIKPLSINEIDWVKIYINDEEKQTLKGNYEVNLVLSNGTYTIKAKMRDTAGNEAETEIKIGVNVVWDFSFPTPTPTPILTITPAPTITVD